MTNRVLDDALERLRGMGPEAVHGAPNHGPMAAEALIALGCSMKCPCGWTTIAGSSARCPRLDHP
jgi:hypothetical protein